MPLVKLKFRPGVDKEGTDYENTVGWYDSDKIRFRAGFPEKIGGWEEYSPNSYVGVCRHLKPWTALDSTEYLATATNIKLYVETGQAFYDITPVRSTASLGTDPFSISAGSAEVTVTHTSHGAIAGAYVTFSGATSSDATLDADVMNQEYVIDSVTDANTYVVTMTTTATGTDATEGGASVTAEYQINPGLDTAVIGTGWGVDTWGSEAWGEASTAATDVTAQLRLWTMTNFGEDLVANIRNGDIYTWDTSSGTGTRAVTLASLSGASNAPTIARRVLTSSEDRILLALACDPVDNIGTQDTLLVRWADAEGLVDWTPDTDNTAGSLRLSNGSEIITGIVTKRDILVWTDTALHSLTYVGAPFFYGVRVLSSDTRIISPEAAVEANDITFWMGQSNFYYYDGSVKTLPCTLREYVFDNINKPQSQKVFAGVNSGESEVWWFYPKTTDECDSYVVFNYQQQIWYHGTMTRTAWTDRLFNEYPIAAYTDNKLYNHEKGCDDGTTTPASGISAYAESSQFEPIPGDGYQYSFARRLIPDVTFTGSEASSPAVSISITPRDYPGDNVGTSDSSTITRSATTPVEQYTKQAHIRVRGREMVYRIESTDTGVKWRDGTPRLEVRPDGRQ
jgi:hypothetical protein